MIVHLFLAALSLTAQFSRHVERKTPHEVIIVLAAFDNRRAQVSVDNEIIIDDHFEESQPNGVTFFLTKNIVGRHVFLPKSGQIDVTRVVEIREKDGYVIITDKEPFFISSKYNFMI